MTRAQAWRPDAAILLACLFWGLTFVITRDGLQYSSTLVFLTARFTLASVLALLFFRAWTWPKPTHPKAEWTLGLSAGLVLFFSYWTQSEGLRYTTASKSAFLTGLNVVLVPILAAILTRRIPGPSLILGVLLATSGLALMTLEGPLTSINPGDALSILCALLFAIHVLVIARAARFHMPRFLTIQIAVVALCSLALAASRGPLTLSPAPAFWTSVIITAIFPTVLAFALLIWAQRYTPPARVAILLASEPVFGWLGGFLWMGETLSPRATLGALLILLALLAAELRILEKWFLNKSAASQESL